MGLVKLDLHPDAVRLRDFGDIALCMCVLLALLGNGLLGWSLLVLRVLALVGMGIYLLSRISSKLVLPIYRLLMIVSFPIGWVIGHLVLGIFFYVVIGIVGLVFRVLGRDPLKRKYDPEAETYWEPYQEKKNPARYFQQF